jgi:hypothetical protein
MSGGRSDLADGERFHKINSRPAARGVSKGCGHPGPCSRFGLGRKALRRGLARAASVRVCIVYLPMRGSDTPSPAEVAAVAGGAKFQSMTCLTGCAASPRFCSVGWDRTAAWCSYTRTRAALAAPTFAALQAALSGLGLEFFGGTGA